MAYVWKPSLKHMSFIKVVATLCNQEDVKDLLKKFHIDSNTDLISQWEEIEAIIVKKVAKLPLPKQVNEEMLCLIRTVGFQILKWSPFHYISYNLKVDLPKEFYWMPQGTIDKKKTAQVMIEDESIDTMTCYTLACIYCLEDDIPKLWNKIPQSCRKSFYNQEDPKLVNQNELVVFWTYQIKQEVVKLDSMIEKRMDRRCSPYQYAFKLAASNGNKVATEYFLQKLTSTEREESLVETAKSLPIARWFDFENRETNFLSETFSHVLCFLLSELNEEQQIEVFESSPHLVLVCFLDWPLQIFFMETANRMWNILDKEDYGELLLRIIHKIKLDCKDFDYQKLFGEFWKQSPNGFKKHILSEEGHVRRILSDLFQIRDKNTIKLVFQDATSKDKKHIFYNNDSHAICKKLMKGNQLSLLEYFIKECLPSKDEVMEFKRAFQHRDVWRVTEYRTVYLTVGTLWEKNFLRLLDDVMCEFNKRKCEEGDSNTAKRVCGAEYKGAAYRAEK